MKLSPHAIPAPGDDSSTQGRPRAPGRLGALAVGLVAALSCSLCGLGGPLHRDAAKHLYTGQQLVRGVPPYVSMFNHVPPLSPMLCGAAVAGGRALGVDDVAAVRLVFIAVAILAAVILTAVGRHLTASTSGAAAAGITLLCFGRFVLEAASGPDKKVLLILLEALFLLAVARRRWFLAGIWGTLALLVWQGALVFPLVAAGLIAFEARGTRGPSWRRLTFGVLLPLLLVSAYFAANRALNHFFDGVVLVNLRYLEPGQRGAIPHVVHIATQAWLGYPGSVWLLVIGLVTAVSVGLGSGGRSGARSPLLARAIIASAAGLAVVSMVDFQGPPDLFPFLPFACLGIALLVHRAGESVRGASGPRALLVPALVATLATTALTAGLGQRRDSLATQRRTLQRLFREVGEPQRLLVIGEPAALVLSRRTNPTRFVSVYRGIDRFIDDRVPGGFSGWVASLARHRPDLVIVGPVGGALTVHLHEWYRKDLLAYPGAPWRVLVQRSSPRHPPPAGRSARPGILPAVSRPRFARPHAPLLAAASGLALALALPGPNWAPLALFFPGLLLEALQRAERARTAVALGQLAGTVHWAVATSWVVSVMHAFGGLPLPLAVVSLLVMAGLLGLTWAATATVAWLAKPALRVWLLPLAWTALEAFRQWPPYQFPWNPTAACLAAWPAALGSLPVWGASGLGWALTASGAGLWGLLRRETRVAGVSSLAASAALLALMTAVAPAPRPDGEPVAVAVLQPGTTLEEKWDPERWDEIYGRVYRLAAEAAAAGAELELWPESAVPSRLDLDPGLRSTLTELAGRLGVEVVVNSIGSTEEGGYTNAAYLVSGAGVSPERYDKVRLVPFGEYVPLLGRFAFTRSLVREVPAFTPGGEVRLLPARIPLGVAICYEVTFADLVARQVRLGAGLLGTVTNDGWYGFSSAPPQHFAQAVLRAAESRRWVARAALTGISGFVDPTGRVTQRLDVGRPGFLVERLQPMTGLTPRSRWGDWWGVVCAVVSLVALGRLGAGRHRR